MTSVEINKGWSFTQLKSDKFKDVTEDWQSCKVPTQTHVELKRLGKIPDPFKGLDEWAVQCEWFSSGLQAAQVERGRERMTDIS